MNYSAELHFLCFYMQTGLAVGDVIKLQDDAELRKLEHKVYTFLCIN